MLPASWPSISAPQELLSTLFRPPSQAADQRQPASPSPSAEEQDDATKAHKVAFEKFIDKMNKDQAKDLARKINLCGPAQPT